MSQYEALVTWSRGDAVFTDVRYSREHRWEFDGGVQLTASASPHAVPVQFVCLEAVDPEEAFVASLASCHMLWFLWVAADRGFVVDDYRDAATGTLAKNADGRLAMTEVTLHPRVRFGGEGAPSAAEHQQMHEAAHEACFIATSVKSDVRCEPEIV